jgi:hypothetical protein
MPDCRGAEWARELAGDASERGPERKQKGKREGAAVGAPCCGAGRHGGEARAEAGVAGDCGRKGKLTGGTRPSAALGEGKVKGRDASRWWAGPWSAAVLRGLCFTGEKKEGSGPSSRAGGLST